MRVPLSIRVSSLPGAVRIAVLAWSALLLSWSLLLPIYRSADEVQHVAAVRHVEHHWRWPGFKQLQVQQNVVASVEYSGFAFYTNAYGRMLAGDAVPRADRPSYADAGSEAPSRVVNQMAQHPPGYYVLGALLAWVLPADLRFDVEVMALRMLCIALMAPLPLLVALVAKSHGGDEVSVTLAALLTMSIPQLAAISGAVNNDSLLNASSALVMLGIALIAAGDLSIRLSTMTGLALAVALMSKAWGLLLVPFVGLAYLAGARGRWRRAGVGLMVAAAFGALGGWWWLRNLMMYGVLQPAGHASLLADGPLSLSDMGLHWLGIVWERLPTRFWAFLSIKPGSSPFPLWFTGGLSALLLAWLAVLFFRVRTFNATRRHALLLCGPFLLGLCVLLAETWGFFSRTGLPSGIQGRYLYFSLAGVLSGIALAIGATTKGIRVRNWLPLALWLGVVVFVGISQYKALSFHWAPESAGLLQRVEALLAWSPFPGYVTVATYALLLGSSLWVSRALYAMARQAQANEAGDTAW